jgi:hypothetical protein
MVTLENERKEVEDGEAPRTESGLSTLQDEGLKVKGGMVSAWSRWRSVLI